MSVADGTAARHRREANASQRWRGLGAYGYCRNLDLQNARQARRL